MLTIVSARLRPGYITPLGSVSTCSRCEHPVIVGPNSSFLLTENRVICFECLLAIYSGEDLVIPKSAQDDFTVATGKILTRQVIISLLKEMGILRAGEDNKLKEVQ